MGEGGALRALLGVIDKEKEETGSIIDKDGNLHRDGERKETFLLDGIAQG